MWKKAENYIETNYSYPVTVEDVADYVGISRSHLFPLFSDLYELFAKGIFVPVQDQAGMQAFKGD